MCGKFEGVTACDAAHSAGRLCSAIIIGHQRFKNYIHKLGKKGN
jgi:hypothetical protein